MTPTTAPIVEFLNQFAAALEIATTVDVEMSPDGPRLNLSGEEAEILVRHRGEPLKALQHGVDVAFGPLNPYERRIVHLAAAEVPGVATESVGDAFSKTVHISVRK